MMARFDSRPPFEEEPPPGSFAARGDHAECRRLHRRYGTTYYFATQAFPRRIRRRVNALYGFVRVPDEWVDNPEIGLSSVRVRRMLDGFRGGLIRGLDGVRPEHPVLRAFVDVMRETEMPLDEPLLFLDAMAADLDVERYATYSDLVGYMRGSATAVGLMMCHMVSANLDDETVEAATALSEAMQLTNFLRDVGEDFRDRGRVYLPQDELARHGLSDGTIERGVVDDAWRAFMREQIVRARGLYAKADEGIPNLPRTARVPVRLARILYAQILDKIEEADYDVFRKRARTTRREKLTVLVRVLLTRTNEPSAR